MKNVDWNRWASIAEVVGTVAVIVSLAFVVRSVDQNTEALRNTNLNHVYDRLDSLNSDIGTHPQLAVTYADRVFGLSGMDADEALFLVTMRRELNQWEQYFAWHQDRLLDEEDWTDWDDYYTTLFGSAFPEEWWQSMRQYYNSAFSSHVDQAYGR